MTDREALLAFRMKEAEETLADAERMRDVTNILKISGEDVDQKYISEWAQRLNLTEDLGGILKRLVQKS